MIKAPTTPGPGIYDIKSTLGESPRYSLSGRHKLPQNSDFVPGPGQYNYDVKPKHQPPSYSMSGRFKFKPIGFGPGPGAYSSDAKKGGPSITMAPRVCDKSVVLVSPGPAAYTFNANASASIGTWGPKYSFLGRHDIGKDRRQTPGPGTYQLKPIFGEKTDHAIQLKGRPELKGDFDNMPGPGKYNPDVKPFGSNAPRYTFRPKTETKQPTKNTPGPGAYALPPTIGVGLSKSLSSRHEITGSKGDQQPGPGQYNVIVMPRIKPPQFTMRPKTQAVKTTTFLTPGPGQYQLASTISKNGPSLKGRLSVKDTSGSTPGPAHYQSINSNAVKRKPPSFSMASGHKSPVNPRLLAPGPGAYSLPEAKVPAPTLKGRHEVKDSTQTPGPGQYNLPPRFGEGPKLTLSARFLGSDFTYANSQNTGTLHLKPVRYSATTTSSSPIVINNQLQSQPLSSSTSASSSESVSISKS
eukprot:TRINITY_DN1562_c0_g1_i1.p1 TRINITY_DN1562_c0_g1~~TRINITY_DN1562_c0_g1_i1.p1  ORF type:complete len:467 (+),score=29.39 TRINITY_DN1562_c0_g1_i1:155-1555(+)